MPVAPSKLSGPKPCPRCGGRHVPPPNLDPGTAAILQVLTEILGWETPPSTCIPFRKSQANGEVAPSPTAYYAVPIPTSATGPLHFWAVRNLSGSTNLYYWFTNAKSAPPDAYFSLPPNGYIARDSNPPYITVAPDPSATDAGWEFEFWFP